MEIAEPTLTTRGSAVVELLLVLHFSAPQLP